MKSLSVGHYALCRCLAVAILAGCGGSQVPISAPGALPLSSAAVEFAYVTNRYSSNVSAYAINPSDGSLTQVQGSPFAAGYGANAIAIHPTGKFAYVANDGAGSSGSEGNVSAFTINPRNGALTPVKGSPFSAGSRPVGIAISPNGKFAFVVNYVSANISTFAINARTGGLTQVKGSPRRTRPNPTTIEVDPTGHFVYQTHMGYKPDLNAGHIGGYAFNALNGALTKLNGAGKTTGLEPESAAIDGSGKFFYIANWYSESVSAFAITAKTGALNEVKGSPFPAGYNAGAVAVDPSGSFVYVPTDDGIDAYTISSNGSLTRVKGSPFSTGYEPDGAAVDPLGKFVYVSSTGEYGDVSAYAINPSSGALTQVKGSPFAAGQSPAGIATCEIEHDGCVPATK